MAKDIMLTQTITLLGAHADFEVKEIPEGFLLIIQGETQRHAFIEGSAEQMDKLCFTLEAAMAGRRKLIFDKKVEQAIQQLITINALAQALDKNADRLGEFQKYIKEKCSKIIKFTALQDGEGEK
jgi:hypothetical protein